jgi:hypothetical protein
MDESEIFLALARRPETRVKVGLAACHCTFAFTVALPFRVNVQAFWVLLPFEQAPDQSAVLPFETARVTLVPDVNGACIELPTATLIPAGLEVTLWPVRPLALTVRVTVGGGGGVAGFTNRGASSVLPPAVAKTVNPVCVVTATVGTEKPMLV